MTADPASRPAPPWTIDDKLCLITGATSGIGAATAKELADRGAHVLLVARDPTRGRATAEAITAAHPDAQVEVLDCDLARLDDVRHLARTVQDSYGRTRRLRGDPVLGLRARGSHTAHRLWIRMSGGTRAVLTRPRLGRHRGGAQ